MKATRFRILLIALCAVIASPAVRPAPSPAAGAGECARYADAAYGYSLCAPPGWRASFHDIGYRRFFVLKKGDGAEIAAAASRYDGEEKIKWDSWKRWYAQGMGRNPVRIVETDEMSAGGGVTFRMLICEYTARRGRVLQRTMLARFRDTLLVIECRAPLRIYARYTGVFNMVMTSVDFQGRLKGRPVEDLADEKGKERYTEPAHDTEADGRNGRTMPDGSSGNDDSRALTEDESSRIIQDEIRKIEELERRGIIERIHETDGGAAPKQAP